MNIILTHIQHMKNLYNNKSVLAIPLLLATVLAPASTYAEGLGLGLNADAKAEVKFERGEKHEVDTRNDDHDEKRESREFRKDHGTTSTSSDHMRLPKGIEKRIDEGKKIPHGIWRKFTEEFGAWFNWFGKHEVKADVTNPVITSVNVNSITSTSAVVVWTTDEKTNGKLWYSTSTVDTNATSSVSVNEYSKFHTVTLDNLSASTTYKFVVKSSDKAGNVVVGSQGEFTTR